jgi:hypothetical protein
MEQHNFEKPFSDEEESGFDIMESVADFIYHWYLIFIAKIFSLGLAYLENRSWLPRYQTAGTIMIEGNRMTGGVAQNLMQGFGVESGYKNTNNQVIMLGSYDLVSRVVDSIPFLKIDYISKGSFKTRNLYKRLLLPFNPIMFRPKHITLHSKLNCARMEHSQLLLMIISYSAILQ